MLRYRPEIDGLRAIAVLAVVLFHAQFSYNEKEIFSGGFVGVDVFLVISGYLITGILRRNIEDKNFSLLKFYERRARRILPALIFVIFVSLPFAYIFMLPKAFYEYLQSLFATLLFSSNILFWFQDSYTAEPSILKPFLHTWSLGVEEQFYLFFPPLLYFSLLFLRRYSSILLLCIFALSFVLAVWGNYAFPDASFYLLPMRIWELLAGAFLALRETQMVTTPLQRKTFPAAGLALILFSIFFYAGSSPIWGIIPAVFGTFILIAYTGGNDTVTRVLRFKPVVGIGLISYSFYLWHQPVFAFFRLNAVKPVEMSDKLGLVALSLVLGIASWRFIEQPFRDRSRVPAKSIWVLSGTLSGLILVVSIAGMYFTGSPKNLPSIAQSALDALKEKPVLQQGQTPCLGRPVENACTIGMPDALEHWVIAGDSHLDHLGAAFADAIKPSHSRLTMLTMNACPYIEGVDTLVDRVSKYCVQFINQSRAAYLKKTAGKIVVMGGRMPLYLNREMFDNGEGGIEKTNSILLRVDGLAMPEAQTALADAFRLTVQNLLKNGHRIVLLYPVPEVGWDVPHRFVQTMPKTFDKVQNWIENQGVTTPFSSYARRAESTFQLYNSVPDHPKLLRIYPDKLFCNTRHPGRCVTHDDEALFYVDDDHLSLVGARLVVDEIMSEATKAWPMLQQGTQQ